MRVPLVLPSRTGSEVVVAFLKGGHALWRPPSPLMVPLRPMHSNDTGVQSAVASISTFVHSKSLCIRIRMTPSHIPKGFRMSSTSKSESTTTPRNEMASEKKAVKFTDRVVEFVGRLGGFYSTKAVLTRNAKTLYESCIDNLDYEAFFKACHMPDSFQSWFLIAHLHVWLCMVRLKREGKGGNYLTKQIVSMFWYDVEQRIKVLGVHSSSVVSKSLRELVHEFYGLTLAYDEGLLSDDRTLAAAIWRNLIGDKAATDPSQLARVVEYVRRQVQHMDHLDSEQLMTKGNITLLPLK